MRTPYTRKRYQVRFTDAVTGEKVPDAPVCWHDTLELAERFAALAAVEALEWNLSMESAIYVDGRLHHEHCGPRRLQSFN